MGFSEDACITYTTGNVMFRNGWAVTNTICYNC